MASNFPDVPATPAEPSIGELIKSLVADLGQLVRTEIRQARAEVAGNVASLKGAAVMIGAALVFGIAALVYLFAAVVGFLLPYVGPGAANLIAAAGAGLIAFLLLRSGTSKLSATSLAPLRTIESVKTDVQTIKGSV